MPTPSSSDPSPQPPRWKQVVLGPILVVLFTVVALVFSSNTASQTERHGSGGWPQPPLAMASALAEETSEPAPSFTPVPLAETPNPALSTPEAAPTATVESTPTATPQGPVYPVAVMVENQEDARPQSGLCQANIVYEAPVEGGITRFMAIYMDGQAQVIGPVRSARHYFVYLAAEYNASYIHIGASPQGYEALSAVKLLTLDETYGDPGFWRSNARYAPHNAYTGTDTFRPILEKSPRYSPGSFGGFVFRDGGSPIQGAEAGTIRLVYPGGYQVRYEYSPEDKLYRRYMEGLPHRDADSDQQVSPRNVVVQYVSSWVIDDIGRLDMEQVGEGKALFFRDGVVTEGFWQKPSYGDVTRWYDADWNQVEMNRGKTWVQIIPTAGKVSY